MARATLDAVDIMDVAGFDTIIIETVGVGQDEVEIVRASHTTIVVSAPGLGDEIQAIKAGILEIADIHVVSKSDRSDANRTMTEIKQMLMLGLAHGTPDWTAPVIGTSSVSGQGLDDLITAIEGHRTASFETEIGRQRLLAVADFRLRKTAETILLQRFADAYLADGPPLVAKLSERRADPYSLANELLGTPAQSNSSEGAHPHEQDARSKFA